MQQKTAVEASGRLQAEHETVASRAKQQQTVAPGAADGSILLQDNTG